MKSAKLVGIRQFEIFDLPAPEIGKGEVLVAIKSAGICASDVHYYHHGRIGDQVCVFPQVLGHECAGVVVKAFNGSLFNEGDRVAVEPGLSCGSCEHCLCGRYNICPNVKFLGGPGIGGAFQEFLPLDERQLHVIPADMGFDEAALLEPLGVAYHAVCLSEVKPCDTIAVFGAGAVGQLTAAMAVVCGASEIFLFDKEDRRLSFAKKTYGFDHCVNCRDIDPLEYIRDRTRGRGVDIVYEAAGEQETITWSLEAVRIGGSVLLIGIPSVDRIVYDPHPARRRELLVRNVRRSNRALPHCIGLFNKGKIVVAPLATHRFPLSAIAEAFSMAARYSDGVVRAMITF